MTPGGTNGHQVSRAARALPRPRTHRHDRRGDRSVLAAVRARAETASPPPPIAFTPAFDLTTRTQCNLGAPPSLVPSGICSRGPLSLSSPHRPTYYPQLTTKKFGTRHPQLSSPTRSLPRWHRRSILDQKLAQRDSTRIIRILHQDFRNGSTRTQRRIDICSVCQQQIRR